MSLMYKVADILAMNLVEGTNGLISGSERYAIMDFPAKMKYRFRVVDGVSGADMAAVVVHVSGDLYLLMVAVDQSMSLLYVLNGAKWNGTKYLESLASSTAVQKYSDMAAAAYVLDETNQEGWVPLDLEDVICL